MGIEPCVILDNQYGIITKESLITSISDKTGFPVYNKRDSKKGSIGPHWELSTLPDFAGYEAWDFSFQKAHGSWEWKNIVFSTEDYFIVTPPFVLCRIEQFEHITWQGILRVFQLHNGEEDQYLKDAWKHMIASYKEFGELFYSSKILVCADAECEVILEILRENFTDKALEKHYYKLLKFDTPLDETIPDETQYLYFEEYVG
ncbi:MAG TPA: hypothetical protein PLW34_02185 [Termitinemataceae bacterium]|nr:hypothetical protein [Termitinemataceae bacterium]HOM23547.1 hypothetical protein [Termitinemataceae bacterium]HPP99662.1 hypothetical protein [Termitinemataceae bacterium]